MFVKEVVDFDEGEMYILVSDSEYELLCFYPCNYYAEPPPVVGTKVNEIFVMNFPRCSFGLFGRSKVKEKESSKIVRVESDVDKKYLVKEDKKSHYGYTLLRGKVIDKENRLIGIGKLIIELASFEGLQLENGDWISFKADRLDCEFDAVEVDVSDEPYDNESPFSLLHRPQLSNTTRANNAYTEYFKNKDIVFVDLEKEEVNLIRKSVRWKKFKEIEPIIEITLRKSKKDGFAQIYGRPSLREFDRFVDIIFEHNSKDLVSSISLVGTGQQLSRLAEILTSSKKGDSFKLNALISKLTECEIGEPRRMHEPIIYTGCFPEGT